LAQYGLPRLQNDILYVRIDSEKLLTLD